MDERLLQGLREEQLYGGAPLLLAGFYLVRLRRSRHEGIGRGIERWQEEW